MERCEVQYSRPARRSFEKAHGEAAPARLQVIGFNVSPKAEGGLQELIESSAAGASYHELSFDTKTTSPSVPLPKPASSPRSALQQLLLHQSLPSTSSPFSNHSLPPLLPPSTTTSSSANHPFPPAHLLSPKPATSSPSSNHNLTSGLALQLATSPPAANQKSRIADQLLQPAISPPAATQNCTSGFSKFQSRRPASAYQTHSSSGHLKSPRQSEYASSDVPANQSSRTSLFSSLGQSQCASSSSGNQSMRGSGVSVNMQIINQNNSKPSEALIKENYEAFFQINQTGDDKTKEFNNGSDAKALEISAKEVINGLPFVVAKSHRSSWLHDDIDHPSEKCKKSSWKGVQEIHEHPLGNEKSRKSSWNEEKGKKSSLFIFMASSPAVEFHHHHHHHAEHNTSKNMDFLSSCHLCRRLLGQGQDVFMYSGDKAFCSMECRYQQIVMDERKERCPPPIIRSGASQVFQHSSVTATTTSHHPIMINKPHFINTAAAA